MGCNELKNLCLREMLSVPVVEGIAGVSSVTGRYCDMGCLPDFVQVLFKLCEVRLGHSNTKLDEAVRRSTTLSRPSSRGDDGLLDLELGVRRWDSLDQGRKGQGETGGDELHDY